MNIRFFLLSSLLISGAYGADLYESDFSVDGQGATHDSGSDTLEASPVLGENWSIFWDVDPLTDSSTNSFVTQGGILFSEDWGGFASFETDEIDVSGVDSINIVALASTRGNGGAFNAGSEQFAWYYLLDGARTDGPVFTEDGDLNFSLEGVDVSGVSALKVGFTFNINGGTDGFDVTSITVNDGVASPEIALESQPDRFSENGGFSVVKITIPEALAVDQTFNVSVGDTDEVFVDATATVIAGSTFVDLVVTAINDAEADGPQLVTLAVTDPNNVYKPAETFLVVTDDEPFTAPALTLNEIRINANSAVAGNGEYFELVSSQANASLDRVYLVAIGSGTAAEGSGVVEEVIDLSGNLMNGNFFVGADPAQELAESPDFETELNFENDNVTFLLVTDFISVVGADLDADDDGTLDSEPWGELLDGVALVSDEGPRTTDQLVYGASLSFSVVGPDVNDNGSFIPAHIYRAGNNPSTWLIGTFFALDPESADTPGALNQSGDGVIPAKPEILSLEVDRTTRTGALVVSGLGSSIFKIEYSDDLTENSVWQDLAGGYTESDNPDGTITFSFTDPELSTVAKRFYRINIDLTP